jgi:hypothetical protein
MKYLNAQDNFTKGEYKDDSVYDVADEDPGYLQRLLNNLSVDAEEAEIIRGALGLPEEE